ncbi:sulfotransferase domain-containing protein [Mangrovicoccus ximenensis]|uniref:sulfotransferase domain-containing protein n=1 Tax=Mangrovicoccus ximenensis TaxID=1911570 RepID=UPI000D35862C|nr:sulfotransferase domain-containing protein [Mangrovicoccus ximenensis]
MPDTPLFTPHGRHPLTPVEMEALWRAEDARDPELAAALFALRNARPAPAPAQCRPDFLIIGTMKGGTTSLYDHICRHPQVVERRPKEIHYFSMRRDRSEDWYRSFFAGRRPGELMGEASPSYFDMPFPDTPARIAALAPTAHLFLILADPARRAVSEYYHDLRWSKQAVDAGGFVAPGEELNVARLRADLEAGAPYLRTGFYEKRMPLWEAPLAAGKLSLLTQQALRDDPAAVTAQAWAALGLPEAPLDRETLRRLNRNRYPAPAQEVRDFLAELYADTVEAMRRNYGVAL